MFAGVEVLCWIPLELAAVTWLALQGMFGQVPELGKSWLKSPSVVALQAGPTPGASSSAILSSPCFLGSLFPVALPFSCLLKSHVRPRKVGCRLM